ncbi:MAG TPA: hypothetical protein VN455_12465 [Methanotrichaceae archaeon]|nr:hypothetical protein [Methanotrichaceae archaeon]
MPSTRYTRIEITPEAYLALEAEAILQRKTLKKLASDLILKGVSKKAVEFVQESNITSPASTKPKNEKAVRVIKKIGAAGVNIDDHLLQAIHRVLLEQGYEDAMLYIAQHTAQIQRDELHRVLSICQQFMLPVELAADIIKDLNKIEFGEQ